MGTRHKCQCALGRNATCPGDFIWAGYECFSYHDVHAVLLSCKLNMPCFQKQLAAILALAHLGPYHACIWVGHIWTLKLKTPEYWQSVITCTCIWSAFAHGCLKYMYMQITLHARVCKLLVHIFESAHVSCAWHGRCTTAIARHSAQMHTIVEEDGKMVVACTRSYLIAECLWWR